MMKRVTSFFLKIKYYPILISLFPLWFLYNYNIKYVHISTTYRSLIINLVSTLLTLIIINVIVKDGHKASLIAFVGIALFFSYGHIFLFLEQLWPAIRNLYMSVFWVLVFILASWRILRAKDLSGITRYLSTVALVIIGFSLYQTLNYEIARAIVNRRNMQQISTTPLQVKVGELPDLYYIILDGHARQDVLDWKFSYSSAEFVSQLEALGFYVTDCSQANYWPTEFSLQSTFNMDYLANFLEDLDILPDVLPDWENSVVKQTFDSYNYTSIIFETRATHNRSFGEDILLSRREGAYIYEEIYPLSNLNDYEAQLIKTTWLQFWLLLLANQKDSLPDDIILDVDLFAYQEHYRQTLFVLDELPRVPFIEDAPKFVFVHLLVPHEPFIFSPTGRYEYHHSNEEFVVGYRNNTEFIDQQILMVVEKLIENSANPPIIVIQGDHGPNSTSPELTLPILNAYYLPMGYGSLYETITPVNTFRLIFDEYFGTNYGLLDDVSYFSETKILSNYTVFPNQCKLENQ